MVGGRQLVLMLLPALGAVVVVLVRRPVADPEFRVRGLSAVVVAFLLYVVRFRVLPPDAASKTVLGIAHGVSTLLCVGWFAYRNWVPTRGRALQRVGILTTAVGAGLNAVPVAVLGAMPVLRSTARVAGFSAEELAVAPAQYLVVHSSGNPLTWLGDVLPVPGAFMVLSAGDLLLFVGLAIVAGVLERALVRHPRAPVLDEALLELQPQARRFLADNISHYYYLQAHAAGHL